VSHRDGKTAQTESREDEKTLIQGLDGENADKHGGYHRRARRRSNGSPNQAQSEKKE
jgi:hypothetical protein